MQLLCIILPLSLKPFAPIQSSALFRTPPPTHTHRYMVQDSWFMPLAIAVAQVFFLTPEQGARTSVYLASSPEVANISGKYFVDSKCVQG